MQRIASAIMLCKLGCRLETKNTHFDVRLMFHCSSQLFESAHESYRITQVMGLARRLGPSATPA
jgi:hypothetical protein